MTPEIRHEERTPVNASELFKKKQEKEKSRPSVKINGVLHGGINSVAIIPQSKFHQKLFKHGELTKLNKVSSESKLSQNGKYINNEEGVTD